MTEDRTFSLTKESITQVIGLSTGILALSVTFAKDWAAHASHHQLTELHRSWLLFLLSVLFGLIALLFLTGLSMSSTSSIKAWRLRLPWILQLAAFFFGLLVFSDFGYHVVK